MLTKQKNVDETKNNNSNIEMWPESIHVYSRPAFVLSLRISNEP